MLGVLQTLTNICTATFCKFLIMPIMSCSLGAGGEMDNCIDSKEQYSDSDFDHNFGYLGGKIRFWRCAAASYCLSVHLGGGEKPMRARRWMENSCNHNPFSSAHPSESLAFYKCMLY